MHLKCTYNAPPNDLKCTSTYKPEDHKCTSFVLLPCPHSHLTEPNLESHLIAYTYFSVGDARSFGCYYDDMNDRVLPDLIYEGKDLNPQRCIHLCAENNTEYRYAGVQVGYIHRG